MKKVISLILSCSMLLLNIIPIIAQDNEKSIQSQAYCYGWGSVNSIHGGIIEMELRWTLDNYGKWHYNNTLTTTGTSSLSTYDYNIFDYSFDENDPDIHVFIFEYYNNSTTSRVYQIEVPVSCS